jgi:hypothetical protein
MRCVLGQHDETGRKERAIYYLSKKFTECESRYMVIEKLCCELVWATKRLRHYMLYHTTWLISKVDPLRYICNKPYPLESNCKVVGFCCDVAVAQINYPSFKHNT